MKREGLAVAANPFSTWKMFIYSNEATSLLLHQEKPKMMQSLPNYQVRILMYMTSLRHPIDE